MRSATAQHFDNEYLEECQNHLLKLRSERLELLHQDGGEGACLTGTATAHTPGLLRPIQLVSNGKTTISDVVGQPGAIIHPLLIT